MQMNIYKKIPAVALEISAISKDKKNTTQGFNYRGIDDFYNMLSPLFAKHGVFSVPTVLSETRETRVSKSGSHMNYAILDIEYTFYADDGSSFKARVRGEGMDSGDKASNKALAAAHKYVLMQVFAVPTEDLIDGDSESHETVHKEPIGLKGVDAGLVRPKAQPVSRRTSLEAPSHPSGKWDWAHINKCGEKMGWTEASIKEFAGLKFDLYPGDKINQEQMWALANVVYTTSYTEAMKPYKGKNANVS